MEFKYAWHSLLSEPLHFQKLASMVDDCLKDGANPRNRGGSGVTALMIACKKLNNLFVAPQVVSLLLEHGAEVNQQDFYGRTALHHAFECIDENGLFSRKQIVEILIQHNANIYLKDSSGLSAFDMAERAGHESWLRTNEA